MANISSLLEIIRTAHLGRDMRQALHDSIQAVNNDTETALGKTMTFTNATRKLSLKAKDGTVLSEAVIPGGGSGGGSVDSVNGVAPDENGNVQLTASDVGAMSSSAGLNDISDVTLSSPSNGQVLGYDGSKWKNVSGGSGGGHTIKNESGTALTQRDNLQFKGCAVSDDSTNNATVVSVQTSNRNLLDNAWFTVNQKGVTSGTTTSWFKTLDRWEIASANTSYSLDSNGLQLTFSSGGSASITQYSEDFVNLVGKQLTASIMFSNGNVTSGTVTLTSDANTTFINDGNVRIRYLKESGNVRTIQFTIYNSATIRAVKLELGSQSTLAFDTAPDYTTELLKCQRYLQPIYRIFGRSNGTKYVEFIKDAPVPMRTISPTYTDTSRTIVGTENGASSTKTSSVTGATCNNGIIKLEVTLTSALDDGCLMHLQAENGWLDAQL